MKKLTSWMEQRSKSSYILMLMVGGYLLYMVSEMVGGVSESEVNTALVYAFSVLFAVAAVVMLALGMFAFVGRHYREVLETDKQPEDMDLENDAEKEESVDEV